MAGYQTRRHSDGSLARSSPEDVKKEEAVRAIIEAAWGCKLTRFGHMAPIDWFVTRHERLTGLIELKNRKPTSAEKPTVIISVRKWLALMLGAAGLNCKAIFMVNFADGLFWIPVAEIDATRHRIGGWPSTQRAANDVEPVIDVPIAQMRELKAPEKKAASE